MVESRKKIVIQKIYKKRTPLKDINKALGITDELMMQIVGFKEILKELYPLDTEHKGNIHSSVFNKHLYTLNKHVNAIIKSLDILHKKLEKLQKSSIIK